jgi:hypothetical protein
MNTLHIAALLAAAAFAGAAAAAPDVTPQDMERALASADPKAQVNALLRCEGEVPAGSSVCDKIATGDKTWLELAGRMQQHTDASASIGVCNSIARAARRAPAAALQLFGRTPHLNRECICLPIVSNEIPLAEQYAEYRQSYRAIASVREPSLTVPRASCLAYLEPEMKQLQHQLAAAHKR